MSKSKLSVFLLALSIVGCSCFGGRNLHPVNVTPDVAKDSIYMIKAVITVEKSETDDDGIVSKSTDSVGWRGTAWVIGHSQDSSVLMTAGHVCWTEPTYEVESIDWASFTIKKQSYPVLNVKYTLTDVAGKEIEGAEAVLDDDSVDLCSLRITGDLGVALPIADSDPAYDSTDLNISAPRGRWGNGVAPAIPLTFSGRGTLFDDGVSALYWTGLGDHGSSGSPIFHDGKVVAVLTQGTNDYTRLVAGVPYEVINRFMHLSDALFDYGTSFHISPKK
jgi:hypothetical protein